jgi:hypothetical protein
MMVSFGALWRRFFFKTFVNQNGSEEIEANPGAFSIPR